MYWYVFPLMLFLTVGPLFALALVGHENKTWGWIFWLLAASAVAGLWYSIFNIGSVNLMVGDRFDEARRFERVGFEIWATTLVVLCLIAYVILDTEFMKRISRLLVCLSLIVLSAIFSWAMNII